MSQSQHQIVFRARRSLDLEGLFSIVLMYPGFRMGRVLRECGGGAYSPEIRTTGDHEWTISLVCTSSQCRAVVDSLSVHRFADQDRPSVESSSLARRPPRHIEPIYPESDDIPDLEDSDDDDLPGLIDSDEFDNSDIDCMPDLESSSDEENDTPPSSFHRPQPTPPPPPSSSSSSSSPRLPSFGQIPSVCDSDSDSEEPPPLTGSSDDEEPDDDDDDDDNSDSDSDSDGPPPLCSSESDEEFPFASAGASSAAAAAAGHTSASTSPSEGKSEGLFEIGMGLRKAWGSQKTNPKSRPKRKSKRKPKPKPKPKPSGGGSVQWRADLVEDSDPDDVPDVEDFEDLPPYEPRPKPKLKPKPNAAPASDSGPFSAPKAASDSFDSDDDGPPPLIESSGDDVSQFPRSSSRHIGGFDDDDDDDSDSDEEPPMLVDSSDDSSEEGCPELVTSGSEDEDLSPNVGPGGPGGNRSSGGPIFGRDMGSGPGLGGGWAPGSDDFRQSGSREHRRQKRRDRRVQKKVARKQRARNRESRAANLETEKKRLERRRKSKMRERKARERKREQERLQRERESEKVADIEIERKSTPEKKADAGGTENEEDAILERDVVGKCVICLRKKDQELECTLFEGDRWARVQCDSSRWACSSYLHFNCWREYERRSKEDQSDYIRCPTPDCHAYCQKIVLTVSSGSKEKIFPVPPLEEREEYLARKARIDQVQRARRLKKLQQRKKRLRKQVAAASAEASAAVVEKDETLDTVPDFEEEEGEQEDSSELSPSSSSPPDSPEQPAPSASLSSSPPRNPSLQSSASSDENIPDLERRLVSSVRLPKRGRPRSEPQLVQYSRRRRAGRAPTDWGKKRKPKIDEPDIPEWATFNKKGARKRRRKNSNSLIRKKKRMSAAPVRNGHVVSFDSRSGTGQIKVRRGTALLPFRFENVVDYDHYDIEVDDAVKFETDSPSDLGLGFPEAINIRMQKEKREYLRMEEQHDDVQPQSIPYLGPDPVPILEGNGSPQLQASGETKLKAEEGDVSPPAVEEDLKEVIRDLTLVEEIPVRVVLRIRGRLRQHGVEGREAAFDGVIDSYDAQSGEGVLRAWVSKHINEFGVFRFHQTGFESLDLETGKGLGRGVPVMFQVQECLYQEKPYFRILRLEDPFAMDTEEEWRLYDQMS